MPKAEKKPKSPVIAAAEAAYTMMPWSCNHHPTFSEIEAYIPITGNFEIIADIHDTRGVDAEIVAGLITRAVNSYEKNHDVITQMTGALELCLQCCEGLSWEAEHDADAILRKLEKER